jgi:hypothetical protein
MSRYLVVQRKQLLKQDLGKSLKKQRKKEQSTCPKPGTSETGFGQVKSVKEFV